MNTFTQDLKDKMVAEVIKHREADQILQGTYGKMEGKKWRGCAVGCSIHSLNKISHKKISTSDHRAYEKYLGIPEAIAHLEDTIFEGLPIEVAKMWPERFIKAIPVDADLSLVLPKFYLKILLDKKHGVKQWALEDGKKAIDMVAAVHTNHIQTGSQDEWAAWAARAAAWAAAWAARAAYSTYSAWAAARSAHYEWMADVLIKILKDTK